MLVSHFEFHFKVSLVLTVNAESPASPTRGNRVPALVTLPFRFADKKNASTIPFKLKGSQAFLPAERLFPSDSSLSHVKNVSEGVPVLARQ